MIFGEDYLKLVGQIVNFTKEVTGINIVDAYFDPKGISPEKEHSMPEKLLMNLETPIGKAKEMNNKLRMVVITTTLNL